MKYIEEIVLDCMFVINVTDKDFDTFALTV